MKFELERQSIHEMSNHMTIIQGSVRKVLKDLEAKSKDVEDMKLRLKRADDYIKRSMLELKSLRSELYKKMDEHGTLP